MLTSIFDFWIYVVLAAMFPLFLWGAIANSKQSDNLWFSKHYRAEKYLALTGNLLVLTLSASAVAKLALHFGYIDPSAKDLVLQVFGWPTAILTIAYLAQFISAAIKVRRLPKPGV